MALNPDDLGQLMYDAASAFNNIPAPENPAVLEATKLAYFKAQAAVIVAYFIANGSVSVVTACGAGPGTGSGTIA